MYDAFYGFREKPFSLLPDPDYLYLSPQHEKALGLLELSLHNQAGFCVISGEIGAGKTTLIRKLLTLASPEFRVGLVSNTLDSFGELLNWILLAYDLPGGGTSVEQHERFLDYIIQQYGRGRRTVLIVDEAQNLGVDALEELRMLSNVNADKHQVLQVILVGQSGLRDTLKRPELAQFAQRILMDFHLGPLGREDTAHYIRHRVLVAGADPQLFTDAATAAVFRYSGGVPRIINLLCDTALVYGYAEGRSTIDAELIHAVARERQSSSAAPALRLAAVAPPAAVRAVEPVPEFDAMPLPETAAPAAPPAPPAMEPPPVAEPEPEPEPEAEPEAGSSQTEPRPLVDAPAPSTTMDTEAKGDAEWLRQLADSAVPPSLREAAQIEPEPTAPVPPLVAEPAPVRKAASRPASRARRTGLGRAAGVLLLLTAGVAGYGYFSGEEQDPAQAAETPAVIVPAPVTPPSAESRPAPPPESPRPEVVQTVPTPEPLAESVRPPAEAPASPPAPAPDAPTAEAEPEVAAVREPAAPAPVPSPPKRAAPKPVARPAPAPAPEPVASVPRQPVPVSKPPAVPVPKPSRVAPESDPEPSPPAPTPARSESSAEVVEAPSRPSALEEDSSTADAAPVTAEPQPFTTDPCRGPAARYLSTCR